MFWRNRPAPKPQPLTEVEASRRVREQLEETIRILEAQAENLRDAYEIALQKRVVQ